MSIHRSRLFKKPIIQVFLFLIMGAAISLFIYNNSTGVDSTGNKDNILDYGHFEATINARQIVELSRDMPCYELPLSLELQEFIFVRCNDYGLDYEMVLGVMKLESNFKTREISYNGSSKGLMQLNTNNTAKWLAERAGIEKFDIFNPYHNIECGLWYLNYLRGYWRDRGIKDENKLVRYMLNSYNIGRGDFERYVKSTGKDSRPYDKVVLKYKKQLEDNGKFNGN